MIISRELDKLVADRIMGFDVSTLVSLPVSCPDKNPGCLTRHSDLHFLNGMPLPRYSSELVAAWQVLVVASVKYSWWSLNKNGGGVRANFTGDPKDDAIGTTVEEAICMAALQMKRGEEKG